MIDLEGLRPPEPTWAPELTWVLAAAFSSTQPTTAAELDPAEIWRLSCELALAERIATRTESSALPVELRSDFTRTQAQSAALGLLYEKISRDVAQVAGTLETPIVFLKGLAMVLSGAVPAGGRSFSDIDILVPEDQAEALFDELTAREFDSLPHEPTEQHLPALRTPLGGSLEVHFALRGVEVSQGQAASFEELSGLGHLVPLSRFPGTSFLPTTSLLAAHILVHGHQQHLLRPQTYPLFRMISDLIDVLPTAASWDELARDWHPRIAHAVSEEAFEATRVVCQDLAGGRLPDPDSSRQAAILFWHLLAGALDAAYAESLRNTYLRNRVAEAFGRGELGTYLKRKIRPLFRRSPAARSS